MRLIQYLMFGFFATLLSACGGGGTLESGGTNNGGGSSQDNFQLSLVLLNSSGQEVRQVSASEPGTLRATLRRNGQPFSNQLIRFNLDGNVGVLSPTGGTARTDASGIATIQLLPGANAGSGQVTARFDASSTQVVTSNPFVFDAVVSAGLNAQLSVTLTKHDGTNTREVSHFSPAIAEARLLIDGSPAAFQLINFQLGALGVLNPGNGSAMTDANGIARIDVIAGNVAGASSITANFSLSSQQTITASPYVFTTAGDSPAQGDSTAFNISLSMTNSDGVMISQISNATPGVVKAVVTNSLGQPVRGQVISFSSSLGRIQPAFGTALTNEDGEATIRLTAGTVQGAGSIEARYQARSQSLGFTTAGDEVISQYRLTLEMRDNNNNPTRSVSKNAQGQLVATLTFDGTVLSNQLVKFELVNEVGELIPSIGTARTDNNGVAVLNLFAGNVAGAGMVTATYEAVDETISSLGYVFESSGDQSAETSVSVQLVDNENDRLEVRTVDFNNPRKVLVTLTQGGIAAPFKLVTVENRFAGLLNPTSGRVMTNANGEAWLDLRAGFVAGAGEIIANFVTDGGVTLSSDTFTFSSAGDTPVPGTSPAFSIDLQLISSVTNTVTSEIAANNPGQIVATVLDDQGQPVINKVVSFNSTLGNLRPAAGTALTDASGVARINFAAGTAEGAGTVTAQYEGVSESIGFYTRGDEVDPSQVVAAVNFRLLTNCPADFRTNRNPANCTETTSISAEQPGILFIEVTREGSNTPLAQTLVSAETTLGAISPRTGTAITDINGIALLDLVAGRDVGAGEVTVTAINTNRVKAFEIGAVEVEISVTSSLGVNQTLSAGSTALISVEITRNGVLYNPPLTVEFTSGCVQADLAVIDGVVTSIGGVARSTYRAAGCVGSDLITATVITGGNTVSGTVTVNVSEAQLGSIEFLDVSAPLLALKGTGGANRTETSVVRFRLVDANGNPIAGREVGFSLSTSVGGLELAQLSGFTNAEGIVQTVVRSGIVPTPVRVLARSEQTVGGSTVVVTAPSDAMSVSTGLADQNSFSLSRSAFNVSGLGTDGNEVDVTVFLADHFNNPVPDGTVVNFIAEGGSIESQCNTENGRCSVKWNSQNPRPFTAVNYANTIFGKCDAGKPCPFGIVNNDLTVDRPLGGRATITAYAIGQESFSDLNGNGRFDQGEFVLAYDLTEAFTDHNEDGVFGGKACLPGDLSDPCSPANSNGDEFEEFIDFNSDGSFGAANGLYDGLLCRQEDADLGRCSRDLVNVFQNQEIIMSGDEAYFRLVTYAADCAAIPGVTATPVRINADPTSAFALEVQSDASSRRMCEVSAVDLSSGQASSVSLRLYIADIYNNPLPAGTTVDVSTDNGVLFGTDSFTFPNTTSRVPLSIFFGLTREPATGGNERQNGFLSINVTSPSGLVSGKSIPVADDL
ncbi:Ig domain-containing protein [Alishewanella sp. d11]|uniref:Ig domain-containing protein n=1 Tax=Alishewanella sp. d11 TaxID=3414030 RepID=UPI003BF8F3BF